MARFGRLGELQLSLRRYWAYWLLLFCGLASIICELPGIMLATLIGAPFSPLIAVNIIAVITCFLLLNFSERTDCVIPSCKFLPRCLAVLCHLRIGEMIFLDIGLVHDNWNEPMQPSVSAWGYHLLLCLKPPISFEKLAFSNFSSTILMWMVIFAKMELCRRWLRRIQETTAPKETPSPPVSPTLLERFSKLAADDAQKFEITYVVVEATFIIAYAAHMLVFRPLHFAPSIMHVRISMLLLYFTPTCVLVRIYWCCGHRPPGAWGTLFDTMIFGGHAAIVGFLGSGGTVILSSFFVNNMLSYMLIFVFSFRRAMVVAPVSYVAYVGGTLAAYSNHGDWLEHAVIGLAGLFVSLCLNLAAKRRTEYSKWQTFVMIEEKADEALQEKILRCQAEFLMETNCHGLKHKSAEKDTQSSYWIESDAQQKPSCEAPFSAVVPAATANPSHFPGSPRSAPGSIHLEGYRKCDATASQTMCCPGGGDCLPLTSRAWVAGDAMPRFVGDLKPGERVLCFDRLGKNMKHATILDVKINSGSTAWTEVALADGTCIEVTSNHPMQPVRNEHLGPFANGGPAQPVQAADLRPGEDSLLVLKVVPVPVQSISSRQDIGDRVSLTIQQPERHSMFIASTQDEGTAVSTVAVESANAFANGAWLGEQSTFLEVTDSPSVERLGSWERPPHSSPPSLHYKEEELPRPKREPSLPQAKECIVENSDFPAGVDEPSYDNDESLASFKSSGSASVSVGDIEVVVMRPNEPKSLSPSEVVCDDGARAVGLGEILKIWATGHRSAGSSEHAIGACRPCVHQNKFYFHNTKMCSNGALCNFCHDPGHDELKKKRGMGRSETRRWGKPKRPGEPNK
eukprot:gnl/TRDRNA2_/TRDRNA2_177512_c0_seq1.p1 gnl/TRDRNA2_/TRDRNA2_177512_c0~~gnl/TRDRNA2_/TRDRNA2_177512_c0_seq1.p1  ORF type:complete len:853 (-),score=116.01 gnl/TRDRNA2_/TRDRNA2_177512_c0_seq1:596-3154(-)